MRPKFPTLAMLFNAHTPTPYQLAAALHRRRRRHFASDDRRAKTRLPYFDGALTFTFMKERAAREHDAESADST